MRTFLWRFRQGAATKGGSQAAKPQVGGGGEERAATHSVAGNRRADNRWSRGRQGRGDMSMRHRGLVMGGGANCRQEAAAVVPLHRSGIDNRKDCAVSRL